MNMRNTKTAYLVRLALLMAITILLAATPLGYIPAGALSFTIMVLPVAVGGVLMGLPAGLILGLAFGVTSFLKAPTEALGQLILSYSGLFTAFVCIAPRVCVGLFAGLMHKAARRRARRSAWLYLLTGGGASLVNTALFLGLLFIFCRPLIDGTFGVAIWSSTLLGGVVEMAANAVLTMAVAKALERFVKPTAFKTA